MSFLRSSRMSVLVMFLLTSLLTNCSASTSGDLENDTGFVVKPGALCTEAAEAVCADDDSCDDSAEVDTGACEGFLGPLLLNTTTAADPYSAGAAIILSILAYAVLALGRAGVQLPEFQTPPGIIDAWASMTAVASSNLQLLQQTLSNAYYAALDSQFWNFGSTEQLLEGLQASLISLKDEVEQKSKLSPLVRGAIGIGISLLLELVVRMTVSYFEDPFFTDDEPNGCEARIAYWKEATHFDWWQESIRESMDANFPKSQPPQGAVRANGNGIIICMRRVIIKRRDAVVDRS
ncbi:MAG: hypothetical protein IPJ88_03620 [Myxococcales bacterium]|nr:MAG: hypothetical protein IPJ88_03620 [Myxococcales bacterium]